MIPFLKVKGIRQRWLLNSISILVMILVVVVAAFSLIIKNYYDSSILTDMESKARMAASYFSTEASSYNYNSSGDYLTAAQDYVSSFEDGTRIELQFLNPGGKVIYSSNGLTLSGTMPGTGDITQVQSYQEVATWKGVSSQTGERITAVSAPLLYNGELVGIMRYVTSMRLVDRQVLVMTLVAVILSVSILILVYISNIYFVRSIVDPVKNITGIARRIAGGSYGIQVEKKFDDEVGDLTDAINDMSLRIKQAESMKSEFISSVSHELRTPLTAITGWAERNCWSFPGLRTAVSPCPWSPWILRRNWRTRFTPTMSFWPRRGLPCTIPTARRSSPPFQGTPTGCGRSSATCWTTRPSTAGPASGLTPLFSPTAMRWSSPSETTARAFRRRNCPTSSISSIREAPPPGAAASAWRCARRSSPGTMES